MRVWWTGQQHEGHTWTTLPGPERLYLRQGGIPHSRPARLLHRRRPYLHIPGGSQLPLWRLQDWQQPMCAPGQHGWSQVHQTAQKSVPISRPGQLHDPLLILYLVFFFKRPNGNNVILVLLINPAVRFCVTSRFTFNLWFWPLNGSL